MVAAPICNGRRVPFVQRRRGRHRSRRNVIHTRSQRAGGLINDAHILMRDARPPSGCRAGLQWAPRSFDWVLSDRPYDGRNARCYETIGRRVGGWVVGGTGGRDRCARGSVASARAGPVGGAGRRVGSCEFGEAEESRAEQRPGQTTPYRARPDRTRPGQIAPDQARLHRCFLGCCCVHEHLCSLPEISVFLLYCRAASVFYRSFSGSQLEVSLPVLICGWRFVAPPSLST